MNALELIVGGVALIPVLLGLVEFLEKFGVTGKAKLVASFVLGLGFGLWYQIANNAMPVDASSWLNVVVFGLALALETSGVAMFFQNLNRTPRG